MSFSRLVLVSLACGTLAASTGCLVTSSSSTNYSGQRIEPGADRAVVLGESSQADAIAALGDPTSRVEENGREVLTWRWSERKKSSGSVFLIFGGASASTHDKALHIAFEDGVAARRWRD